MTERTTPPPAGPVKPLYPVAPAGGDLALHRPISATSSKDQYVPANVADGDTSSYWESVNGSAVFPQTLTVDLGTTTTVGRVVMDLPPIADWNQRTQTITILGAGDDGRFIPIVSSTAYSFDARSGDTAGVSFDPVHVRYVRLSFTANSGWPAAQLSELQVFS